jgi:acetyltransferase
MKPSTINFNAFLRPKSIAVIGATERPDTWGNWILGRLLEGGIPEAIYPVNPKAKTVLGVNAYQRVSSIPDDIDMAIIAIPAEHVFEAIRDCAAKGIPAGLIITAGFGEALGEKGRSKEIEIASFARAHGFRFLGPNISGLINLHYGFIAHPADREHFYRTYITFLCQGGYAITDIAIREKNGRRGFGKFIHTGNEADLTIVDFLEYCEEDPETKGICIYIEGLKDHTRFIKLAKRIAPVKPIVVFKAGKTPDGSRAAASHTGSMAGSGEIYQGLFRQAGIIEAPSFELTLKIAHALIESPPLIQPSIGIITMGGSWGVMLTDALVKKGFLVPELPNYLQKEMRRLGMPERASVKNPVDFGAAAGSITMENRKKMASLLLSCENIGGMVVHGYGTPGFLDDNSPPYAHMRAKDDIEMIRYLHTLQEIYKKPVFLVSAMTPLESQVIRDMTSEGIRFFDRLEDVASVIYAVHEYGKMHR